MIKLALTGSIGMGKSATAALFAARGVPVYDADAAVHEAYAPGGEAVAPLEWAFPGVIGPDGGIDRKILREKVAKNPEAMKKLEKIVHPIVGGMQRTFVERAAANGADIVLLDIPLLFETGGDKRADVIAVVTSPPDVQRRRVLSRGQMTEDQFEAILALQTPDSVKRERADFVINTGYGFPYAEAQVDAILETLRSRLRAGGDKNNGQGNGQNSEQACAKSSSIPKPPASIPDRVTAS
ncbi:MAG TPA: dephospho-CoA kinase [Hyphomonadaceae bacterium]|nr:dephospho-CoA kinase [Hyphomonadaceae bacterium]